MREKGSLRRTPAAWVAGFGAFILLFASSCGKSTPAGPSPVPPTSPALTDLYVDAGAGSDASGDGTSAKPYRTLTLALVKSVSGMTIHVGPGLYNGAGGEAFPISLKSGVNVLGTEAAQVMVDGGGAPYVITDAAGSRLDRVTIRGGSQAGILLQNAATLRACILEGNGRGVLCTGDAVVDGNTIRDNSGTGLTIRGTASPTISGNIIQRNGGEGAECLDSCSPRFSGNTVQENSAHGLVCGNSSAPRVEGNTITRNALPEIYLLETARPTLSGNIIRGNARYNIDDARRADQGVIAAAGNTWDNPQPAGTVSGPADRRPNYFIKEAGNSITFSI
jgi:parallel beta-helix repeat protein